MFLEQERERKKLSENSNLVSVLEPKAAAAMCPIGPFETHIILANTLPTVGGAKPPQESGRACRAAFSESTLKACRQTNRPQMSSGPIAAARAQVSLIWSLRGGGERRRRWRWRGGGSPQDNRGRVCPRGELAFTFCGDAADNSIVCVQHQAPLFFLSLFFLSFPFSHFMFLSPSL